MLKKSRANTNKENSEEDDSQGSDFDYLNNMHLGGLNSQVAYDNVGRNFGQNHKANSINYAKSKTLDSKVSNLTTDVRKANSTSQSNQEDSSLAAFEMASLNQEQQSMGTSDLE